MILSRLKSCLRSHSILTKVNSGAPAKRAGTEPHTHGIWSTSFRLVVTRLTVRTYLRTYVRVYRLYGWGRGDYQKEGRGVSGVSWQVHIFNIGF